jgi:hypothetical protein
LEEEYKNGKYIQYRLQGVGIGAVDHSYITTLTPNTPEEQRGST